MAEFLTVHCPPLNHLGIVIVSEGTRWASLKGNQRCMASRHAAGKPEETNHLRGPPPQETLISRRSQRFSSWIQNQSGALGSLLLNSSTTLCQASSLVLQALVLSRTATGCFMIANTEPRCRPNRRSKVFLIIRSERNILKTTKHRLPELSR